MTLKWSRNITNIICVLFYSIIYILSLQHVIIIRSMFFLITIGNFFWEIVSSIGNSNE